MKNTPVPRPLRSPLISAERIAGRVAEMGREISADCQGRPVVAIVVLRGACIFASDLVRRMDPALTVEMEFVTAESYGDRMRSSGRVRLDGPDPASVAGKDLLLVEDIFDSGRTLRALVDRVEGMGPRSVRSAVLLYKDRTHAGARMRAPEVRYIGFHIPDAFVVGYGLDYAQNYRHLPDIRMLEFE